jgi:hypothetical protein
MKAARSRLRSDGRLCLRLWRLEILRLDLGPILYDSDVRRSRRSWRSVPFGPHRQMFELPLLLAPTEGAAS